MKEKTFKTKDNHFKKIERSSNYLKLFFLFKFLSESS